MKMKKPSFIRVFSSAFSPAGAERDFLDWQAKFKAYISEVKPERFTIPKDSPASDPHRKYFIMVTFRLDYGASPRGVFYEIVGLSQKDQGQAESKTRKEQ
jgi:hypothetical protein